MGEASETQIGGTHYAAMPMQPAEFITRNKLGYLEGNVIKYVCRHREKGRAEDLRKAVHYLALLAEYEYGQHIAEVLG